MKYMIMMGYYSFDGHNEEGKPRWIQPAKDGKKFDSKWECEAIKKRLETYYKYRELTIKEVNDEGQIVRESQGTRRVETDR